MDEKMEGRASDQDLGALEVMEIFVYRDRNNGDTTIGRLLIEKDKICDTLEDEPRDVKVKHETRIPANRYEIGFRKEGGFHGKYKSYYDKKFGEGWHKGMLQVMDVPDFEYIPIHCGNTDEDTSGCLLVGTATKGQWYISSSRKAYEKIYPQIAKHLASGGKVFITYIDNDGGVAGTT